MKKRLIQIVQHLRPGGIETMVLDLKSFAPADTDVLIVSLEGQASEALAHWSRLPPHGSALVFMDKAPGLRPQLVARLVSLFRQFRPDAIHTHHIGPLLYGGIAARLAGVTTIIHTEHDAWHLENRRRRAVAKLALSLVRPMVVADARFVSDAFQRSTGYRNTRVILNGIDTERFSPGDRLAARTIFGLPKNAQLVGCAARMTAAKGHAILLRAATCLDDNVHFALAGDGPNESALRQLAADLRLQQRVHFLGRIDDMPTFYRALNVFALPSLAEGLPLAVLEAQSCGIPAVVSNVGGASEAVCPHTGSVVPPKDPVALGNALERTLNRAVVASPRPFVVSKANVKDMVSSYHALLAQP